MTIIMNRPKFLTDHYRAAVCDFGLQRNPSKNVSLWPKGVLLH